MPFAVFALLSMVGLQNEPMKPLRLASSACAEYQRAFIESRLWRNASRTKEQHAADTPRWWLKGCFCLSSLRTTYTALFITFDSELEWCCRKSVQDERCIQSGRLLTSS